ncbi:MAG: glycerate kinase [Clostridia bacterium]|nr:glycerate kinase [Clostridia bacterium]
MKVVVAIDSFKGSVSSLEAGKAVSEGINRVKSDTEVIVYPIADGGEGTVSALVTGMNGEIKTVTASDPLGRKIACEYGIVKGKAIIEIAASAGITLLKNEELNPLLTTTFGVGEIIKDAIKNGCRDFIVGIGGSATNDGGIGMLQALGFNILDKDGNQVELGARGLEKVAYIKSENAIPELKECNFRIACDVENPLFGEKGASRVFARQKGADEQMIEKMDKWMENYAGVVKAYNPLSDPDFHGAGAAGGLGFAFMSFLFGKLERGIDIVLDAIEIEREIKTADIVITGEGRLDRQTVMGKAPVGISKIAKKYNKPVIAFSGCVTRDAAECNKYGIDAFFPVLRSVCTLDEALSYENAYNNIADTVEQVFRAINIKIEG